MAGIIRGGGNEKVTAQGAANNQAKTLNEVKELATQTLKELMIALQDLTQELSGRVAVKDPNKTQNKDALDQKQDAKTAQTEEGSEIVASSVGAQDELEKKKKTKKKNFEEKLKTLSDIVSFIDVKQLNEEDKQEVDTFKKNVRDLNTLNRKLDDLDKEETFLSGILNQDQQKG
jgi:hypothetical protein